MFSPPSTPTYTTSQLDTVEYINVRMSAKCSSDPDEVAWYVGLTGNQSMQEQFAIARNRIVGLVQCGWINQGNYSRLDVFLASRDTLRQRFDDDPTRFTSVSFIVDGVRRFFLLEAPHKH